jgi:hypothetical protein
MVLYQVRSTGTGRLYRYSLERERLIDWSLQYSQYEVQTVPARYTDACRKSTDMIGGISLSDVFATTSRVSVRFFTRRGPSVLIRVCDSLYREKARHRKIIIIVSQFQGDGASRAASTAAAAARAAIQIVSKI